jgi:hypothetical protein
MSGKLFLPWSALLSFTRALLLGFFAAMPLVAEQNESLSSTNLPQAPVDRLLFLDGSTLQGRLDSISPEQGVRWEHPDTEKPIDFVPGNLAQIKLQPRSVPSNSNNPTGRFRFTNQDEVLGNLIALDENRVEIETWFGGTLRAPRDTLRSISFFSKGLATVYRGPGDFEGWKRSPGPGEGAWTFRDGALIASGIGSAGREMNLPDRARIEFDISWTNRLALLVNIYAVSIDRLDYYANSYILPVGNGRIGLQRVQRGAGPAHMGQVQIPSLARKSQATLEIRTNREEASIAILVDGEFIQEWRDPAGFIAQGTGLTFYSQLTDANFRISDIRVSEWDGNFEENVSPLAEADFATLVNKDQVTGQLEGIHNQKLNIVTPQTRLSIPLERVSQLLLAENESKPAAPAPETVRGLLNPSGSVSFKIEGWDDEKVIGHSPNFGPLTFDPKWFHEIQFNLHRSRPGQFESQEAPFDIDE